MNVQTSIVLHWPTSVDASLLVATHIMHPIICNTQSCFERLASAENDRRTAMNGERTISNSHYRSHTGPLLAKCNVLTVSDMYTLELGVFMYRFSIVDLPVAFFKNYFSKRSDIHEYPTRHVND